MPYKNGQRQEYKKMEHGATIMKDTRQKTNRVGANPSIGGEPAKKVHKGEGSKSTHATMGLKIGTRVTSKETRKR